MPNEILFAVLLVSGVGLVIGIMLAVASIVMAVPKDEKEEALLEVLPGANCGACGFSGCSGYAKALSKGEAMPNLCPVGGKECAGKIASILGVEAGDVEENVAVVNCMGSLDNTSEKMHYQGIGTCAAAANMVGNINACSWGCIGLGDCERVCPQKAIAVCNGVAKVNPDLCNGCAMCAGICPKKIITLVHKKEQTIVRCNNCDKGAQTRKDCKAGCIGCMKCTKVCEQGAIVVNNFHATIDPTKCAGCMKCVEACPQGCITVFKP